jgi:hypothetical protein
MMQDKHQYAKHLAYTNSKLGNTWLNKSHEALQEAQNFCRLNDSQK